MCAGSLIPDFESTEQNSVKADYLSARLDVIHRLGQLVTASLDLSVVLQRVTHELRTIVNADRVSVLLLEGDQLRFAATSGEDADILVGVCIPTTAGVAGEVIQTAQPVWVGDDLSRSKIYKAIDQVSGYETFSMLAAPLILNAEVIGVIEAVHTNPYIFHPEELQVLQAAAQWAAIAIRNAQQHDNLTRRLRETQTISEINQAIASTLEIPRVLQLIVDAAHQLLPGAQRAVIHLLDEERQALSPVAMTGLVDPDSENYHMRPGEGVAGKVISEGITINIRDASSDERFLPLANPGEIRSLLVVPVQSGQKRLGTISVQSEKASAFYPEDERLLTTLGVQAALAIENARLYHDLERALQQEKSVRAQLVQHEKLAAMGKMIASVAHELNNPLQAIHNALYLLMLDENQSEQAREDIQVALVEAERMGDLIARLRTVYRPVSSDELVPADLNPLVDEVYRLVATHLRHSNILYDFQPDGDLPKASIVPAYIKQVILNLFMNAVEAMPDGGALIVQTGSTSDHREVYLRIADTGHGIPAEVLPSIFEPFVTTKESGTGLGLTITHDIIAQHGGRIDVSSEVGHGTEFVVWLPVAANPPS
jgi:signal transduction histidine kinase